MSDRERADGLREALRTAGVAAAAVLGAVMLYNVLVAFVDTALNGAFIDWVASQFLDQFALNELGVPAELALDVVGTRYFFFQLGCCVVTVVAVAWVASGRLARRRAARRERVRAAELLRSYLSHDADARVAFPAGWEELALVASDAKRAASERERRLAEETERRNDLITYLAHDLKTPLTSVIGYLSLLDEVPEMPEAQRSRYVGVALAKSRRLEALTNEFFEICRYNLSGIELEYSTVDVCLLVEQLADEFLPLLRERGDALVARVNGTPLPLDDDAGEEGAGGPPRCELRCDAERVGRVLANVLRNAVTYGDPGTEVSVDVDELEAAPHEGRDEPAVRFVVTDTGATIPRHRLEAVFDRFYRLDDARSASTGNAGLGLAIAREIVSLHGGRIWAESEDGRTSFTIELPARPASA